jgi:hypothetical protein
MHRRGDPPTPPPAILTVVAVRDEVNSERRLRRRRALPPPRALVRPRDGVASGVDGPGRGVPVGVRRRHGREGGVKGAGARPPPAVGVGERDVLRRRVGRVPTQRLVGRCLAGRARPHAGDSSGARVGGGGGEDGDCRGSRRRDGDRAGDGHLGLQPTAATRRRCPAGDGEAVTVAETQLRRRAAGLVARDCDSMCSSAPRAEAGCGGVSPTPKTRPRAVDVAPQPARPQPKDPRPPCPHPRRQSACFIACRGAG